MLFSSKIWYFAKFDLLKSLSKDEICMLDKSMEMKVVKKGKLIHFPDMQNHIYFLKKGSINIVHEDGEEEMLLYNLKPGNIFGELSSKENLNFFKNEKAVAVEDSLIAFMKKDSLLKIVQENSEFHMTIHKLIDYKVRKIERKIGSMVFRNCRTRIVDLLIDIAKEYGSDHGNSYVVKNFLTYTDIAKLTATTRTTVVSTINELNVNKLVDYNKKKIEISPGNFH